MNLSRKIAQSVVKHDIEIERVITVLQKYKLDSLLPQIQKALYEIKRREGDGQIFHIESPFPLSKEAKDRISEIVGVTSNPKVSINKKLLAGFKARYNGMLFDGSAERIIKQFISK